MSLILLIPALMVGLVFLGMLDESKSDAGKVGIFGIVSLIAVFCFMCLQGFFGLGFWPIFRVPKEKLAEYHQMLGEDKLGSQSFLSFVKTFFDKLFHVFSRPT